jgi:hypothetical protein
MNSIVKSLFILVSLLFAFPVFSLDFPLSATNYVPAKMPMYPVYPRPDAETQPHARHRWAHPHFRYEIPIGVQGGAWPFKYEIISGPSTATIGEYYGDKDYGILTWSPSTTDSSNVSFHIRVTDQQLNAVDFNWSVTIDAEHFVFIQDDWSGAKSGTINEPLEDWSDWYKGSVSDSTYQDKIIVFRGGKYTISGDASFDGGNVALNGNKATALIGYPGEDPVIDCSSSIIVGTSSNADMFFASIKYVNGRQDYVNGRFFWMYGSPSRTVWWDNEFNTLSKGTSGAGNAAAVFLDDITNQTYNILYKGNIHDAINTYGGGNGAIFIMYNTFYVLIEDNIVKNSNTEYGIWAKTSKAYVTIRHNDMSENNSRSPIVVHYGDTPSTPQNHSHEVCWNKLVIPYTDFDYSFLVMGDAPNHFNQNHENTFFYRNTFVGGYPKTRFKGKEPYEFDGNVILSNRADAFSGSPATFDTSIITSSVLNITGNSSSGIVDANGNLSGSFRSKYLGLVGYEISGKEYEKKPKPVILNVY